MFDEIHIYLNVLNAIFIRNNGQIHHRWRNIKFALCTKFKENKIDQYNILFWNSLCICRLKISVNFQVTFVHFPWNKIDK